MSRDTEYEIAAGFRDRASSTHVMPCHAMQMQMRIIDACVNVRSSRAIQRESAEALEGRAEVQGYVVVHVPSDSFDVHVAC